MNIQAASAWNALLAVSLVALVGAVGFNFYEPAAAVKAVTPPPLKTEVDHTDGLTEQTEKHIREKVWDVESQELEAAVLTQLAGSADKYHIQLSDFRVEKSVVVSGQAEAPVIVVLDGNFKEMMKMIATLEGPDSKLGVNLLQLSASDQGPGFVKATLGLTAFLRKAS